MNKLAIWAEVMELTIGIRASAMVIVLMNIVNLSLKQWQLWC